MDLRLRVDSTDSPVAVNRRLQPVDWCEHETRQAPVRRIDTPSWGSRNSNPDAVGLPKRPTDIWGKVPKRLLCTLWGTLPQPTISSSHNCTSKDLRKQPASNPVSIRHLFAFVIVMCSVICQSALHSGVPKLGRCVSEWRPWEGSGLSEAEDAVQGILRCRVQPSSTVGLGRLFEVEVHACIALI